MAYGQDNQQLLLKEGTAFIGTVTAPEDIGQVGGGDPETHFSGDPLGFFQQGSFNFTIARTYAEALSGTPAERIAKDLTFKDYSLELMTFQFNSDLWTFRDGMLVQPAYADGGFVGDIQHYGASEPTQVEKAILMKSFLRDGTPYNVLLYAALGQGEEVGEARAGTDYVTKPLKLTPFRHPNFTAGTEEERQKIYGCGWLDKTP